MGNELDKVQAGLTVEVTLPDVATLAEVADALFSGKCGWVCTACGARGVKWCLEPEAEAAVLEGITRTHIMRAPKCLKPEISLTFEDVNAAKLLATPAAAIRASVGERVGLPNPAAVGSAGMGPWAKPDYFRCG